MSRIVFKQTYLRIFLFMAFFFVAFLILFTFFLSYYFSKYAYSEISDFSQDKVDQTAQNIEFVFNNLKTYSINMYENKDIHNWLFSSSSDPMVETAVKQNITKYIATQPFIHAAYLINMKMERVYYSRYGYLNFADFKDQEILKVIKSKKVKNMNFYNHNTGENSYLALNFPSTLDNLDYYGYLVILLDKDMLQKYLAQNNVKLSINVIILDENGNLVLGNENASVIDEINRQSINAKKSGNFRIDVNGMTGFANYTNIPSQKWTVFHISTLKEFQQNVKSFQEVIIYSSIALLAVLLIFTYLDSRRIYKPFESLAQQIQKLFSVYPSNRRPEASQSYYKDYNVIKRGIDILIEDVNRLNTIVKDNKELIKKENLRQFITYGENNKSAREYCLQHWNLKGYKHIFLAVLRIESYLDFCDKFDFNFRTVLRYKITKIIEELFKEKGYGVECIDLSGDNIAVLIGCSNNNENDLTDLLFKAGHQIGRHIDLKVVIALSHEKDLNDDFSLLYDCMYELTKLKFIWGDDRIYREKDYYEYVKLVQVSPYDDILDKLVLSVRQGHRDECMDLLQKLMRHMQSMTYKECKLQLIMSIDKIVKSFSTFTSIKDINYIQNYLERANTLKEVQEWLEKELADVMENMNNRKTINQKKEIVDEIVDYIKNRLSDPMLTIDEIADNISLSVSYVRRIFKDVMDITLSEYILNERLLNVKSLLESANLSVAEIAERSGFQTKSSFFTAFKKETGMTPKQYQLEFKRQALKNYT